MRLVSMLTIIYINDLNKQFEISNISYNLAISNVYILNLLLFVFSCCCCVVLLLLLLLLLLLRR